MTQSEALIDSTLSDTRVEKRTRHFTTRGIAIRLFLTCWLVYGLHFATNTVREIFPALSLGDHLSFDVSEYAGLHPDIFALEGRGVFINNNPGASMVGAVPYLLARPVIDRVVERTRQARAAKPDHGADTYASPYPMAQEFYRRSRERGLDIKFGLAAGVIQAFAMAPLSALSAVVMFYIFIGLKLQTRTALLLALLYAFATPVFFRTGQLNQNLLLGHCALFAFALLWRPWDDPANPKRPNYLLAGLLCGWTVVLDYSGMVALLVLTAYGLAKRSSLPDSLKSYSDFWKFAVGVCVCAAILMAYQWSSFGHPLFPAQRYMPPTQYSIYGYNGMDRPHLDLLWDTAFGTRFGLFTSAPLLVLALWVPGWLSSRKRITGNLETWCIVAMTVLFFLFCSANQFGRLQFNSGVRYIVPVVPFIFLLCASVLVQLPRHLAVLIGVVGTYWSWCLAMYRDVELGAGVLEPVKQITFGGLRLPWVTTLERMGYVSGPTTVLLLVITTLVAVTSIWLVGRKRTTQGSRQAI